MSGLVWKYSDRRSRLFRHVPARKWELVMLLTCTCVGIHPGRVELASSIMLTTSRTTIHASVLFSNPAFLLRLPPSLRRGKNNTKTLPTMVYFEWQVNVNDKHDCNRWMRFSTLGQPWGLAPVHLLLWRKTESDQCVIATPDLMR